MDEKKKLEFEKALELRNFEISNFWTRGWFFGALILATASGYFANKASAKQFVPSVCISFLILLFSILQSLMNRGSKYWQERWESVTKNRETELGIDLTKANKYNNTERYYLDRSILAKDENFLAMGQRFSVTKLAFLVWDIICISAIFIWISDIIEIISFSRIDKAFTFKIMLFHSAIIGYIFYFWSCKGYVYENIKKTKKGKNDSRRNNRYSEECEQYIENKIDVTEK